MPIDGRLHRKIARERKLFRRALLELAARPHGVRRPTWVLEAIETARATVEAERPTPPRAGGPEAGDAD